MFAPHSKKKEKNRLLREKLLDNWNPSQRAAVDFCTSPAVIIAGAGTG